MGWSSKHAFWTHISIIDSDPSVNQAYASSLPIKCVSVFFFSPQDFPRSSYYSCLFYGTQLLSVPLVGHSGKVHGLHGRANNGFVAFS